MKRSGYRSHQLTLLFVALASCDGGGISSNRNDQDPCSTNNGGCGDPAYVSCSSSAEEATCTDINACQTNNGGCGDPERINCINNQGAAPTCSDVDECQTDNGGCGDPTLFRCTNREGEPPSCGLAYVPPPDPADTGDKLIGSFYMPAWNMNSHWAWPSIEDYPDRKPLLGYYDEENPEVMDWEIKWAREHGISFFVFDWFRIRCPGNCPDTPAPITVSSLSLGHALHEGFFKSRYGDGDDPDDMKFAVMLTSHHPWIRTFYSPEDVEQTLVPFLVQHYFSRDNYLKIDGKPVLFHYNSNRELKAELGDDIERIKATIAAVRRAVVAAGYPGVILLAENRNPGGTAGAVWSFEQLKKHGFDYMHNYVWGAAPVGERPTDDQAVQYQLDAMNARVDAGVIPFVPGATMGWDNSPLKTSGTIWKLTPDSYNQLLQEIRTMMDERIVDPLSQRMLIVGAWNEISEGHFITPHQEYGFGYLEQIREVFSDSQNAPDYRLPQEVGLGPYDALYQQYISPREPQLVAHYQLEGDAKDASGTGIDGTLHNGPTSAEGIDGKALQFDGVDDHVAIPDNFQLEGTDSLSFGAWIYADGFRQGGVLIDKDGGYRLVVSSNGQGHCTIATKYNRNLYTEDTKVSFEAGTLSPQTWHHLLCVYDGAALQVYVDGKPVGTFTGTNLSGSIQTSSKTITIGGVAVLQKNWFRGRIDEVKIWNYALSPAEIVIEATP